MRPKAMSKPLCTLRRKQTSEKSAVYICVRYIFPNNRILVSMHLCIDLLPFFDEHV